MANIGKRYADAIYDNDKYSDSLKTLFELYNTNEFKDFIGNPKITIIEKCEVIKSLIKIDDVFLNFVKLLLKENRMNIIGDIYTEYMKMLNKEKNILEITIISTDKISDRDAKKIAEKYKKKYSAKEVKYKIETDESIIGGIKVIVDGVVYDDTVKTRLNDILK